MKKSLIFIIFIFLFILICIPFFPAEITGETITGEASAQSLALNITVIANQPPALTIITPKNETYLNNESILLSYSATNEDFVWYDIDLAGDNITITDSIYFSTSQGGHTLYLYANNTYGTTTRNITFTVNSTRFIILYSEYNGSTKGSSTDFINYSYEDIQDLSNVILEHTNWGKIRFNQAINLTEDLDSTDNELDLDSNINISEKRIELNSTALPNFNTPATLWLYNLSFTNPRILKDGIVCSSPNCVIESYTGGALKTLKFNVTSFTVYSAEETPIDETPPGGGGGARITKDFSINPEEIKISLKEGESTTREITIKNIGNREIEIILQNAGLNGLIKINETNFTLKPRESKTIFLEISVNTPAGLYIEKLIISGAEIEKELVVFIEIESKEVLFDVSLKIPRRFTYVLPGEIISAKITLHNLKDEKEVEVNISYIIKDSEREELISEQETLKIEGKKVFTKDFKIPEDAKFGRYILYVKLDYENKIASSSELFTIGKPSLINEENILYLTIIILIILIAIVAYSMRKIWKERKMGLFPIRKK